MSPLTDLQHGDSASTLAATALAGAKLCAPLLTYSENFEKRATLSSELKSDVKF